MHLRIRLGIKFQLKLIVLMFGPNLLKKGIWVLKLKEKSPWRYLLTILNFFVWEPTDTTVF